MKIHWFQSNPTNVGDVLNTWLWPRLLPNVEQLHPSATLVGIGSVLTDHLNALGLTVVVGSGARGPDHRVLPRPDLHIIAVRGPLTAAALGLPASRVTIDPAVLVSRHFVAPVGPKTGRVALVPYFASPGTLWQQIAERLDLVFVSPHWPVEKFLEAISSCDFVITEAMHGAIIADALRIPWFPVRANSLDREGATSTFKWTDWCHSVNLPFRPIDLPPVWQGAPNGVTAWRTKVKLLIIERQLKKILAGEERFLSQRTELETGMAKLDAALLRLKEMRF